MINEQCNIQCNVKYKEIKKKKKNGSKDTTTLASGLEILKSDLLCEENGLQIDGLGKG